MRNAARRTIPTESQEQAVLIEWWGHYARSKGIDERLLFSIPNGANKSIATAMKFKREGLRKGVPDLLLAYPRQFKIHPLNTVHKVMFSGMFIEMKRKGQKATPDQIDFGSLLRKMGYSALICLGADEAMKAIKGYIDAEMAHNAATARVPRSSPIR